MTLKEKILLQKKLDYVKGEIANYEAAIKVGKNNAFNTHNEKRIASLNQELDSILA